MSNEPLSNLLPLRVHLIRATYQWICQTGGTPHIVIDPQYPGVHIRSDLVTRGHMVFNISERAIDDLNLLTMQRTLRFIAYVGGNPVPVSVPIGACLGIYAKETGIGIAQFPEEPGLQGDDDRHPPVTAGNKPTPATRRSHLSVVKPDEAD